MRIEYRVVPILFKVGVQGPAIKNIGPFIMYLYSKLKFNAIKYNSKVIKPNKYKSKED